jgi:hypothetical protein
VLLSTHVAGCGPKIKTALSPNAQVPHHLALLPADYSVDIPRERVDLVRISLLQEMRNRNFIVAEDTLVSKVCSTPQCPERKRLASEYMVDGFVTLTLESFSKNSFLAGYYNQLSGVVSISDVNNKELFALEHTQSERGGLIFNSGQVLQGIISQVKNTGDDAYRDLSQKFALTVAGQLPLPQQSTSVQSPESLDLSLTAAVAQPLTPTSYSVCAQGTPHSIAALLVGTHRTTLREVTPGRYCAAFSSLVAAPESSPAYVELRTVYGNSLRQPVRLPARPPCKLDGRVKVNAGALRVECAAIGRDRSQQESGCVQEEPRCVADKIVLFKATSPNMHSFQKVGESRTAQLSLPGGEASYELIAVDESGTSSVSTSIVHPGNTAAK